jgi:hypothetical protein
VRRILERAPWSAQMLVAAFRTYVERIGNALKVVIHV